MSDVVIFGNASIARLAYYDIAYRTKHTVVAFAVDKDFITEKQMFDLPVIDFENIQELFPPGKCKLFIAAGFMKLNKIREERYLQAKEMGYSFISIISERATIYPDLTIGENCYIGHNAVVYNDVSIGNNVFIGAGCNVAHDVVIKDHCFFSDAVAVSGFVNIGTNCFLGTNSTIRNKVTIGDACIIGAGANILEDIDDKSVIIGEPSRILPISSDKLPVE